MPKPESTRQRRNKASTRTTLSAVDASTMTVPALPKHRKWHKRTEEHWEAVWQSPMAPEFDMQADLRAMTMLAEMWDDFYLLDDDTELSVEKKVRLRILMMGQIMKNEQRFGLTPLDRRRLQWEVLKGDEADEKTRERRNRKAVAQAGTETDDPRAILTG